MSISAKLNFSLYTQYGALNSPPIFQAFADGCRSLGHEVSVHNHDADVAVIWSVLWDGRMRRNREIWNHYRNQGKNVIVLEVGTLARSITWRVGINGINREATFGPSNNDSARRKKFKLKYNNNRTNNNAPILICTQSEQSRQWRDMPPLEIWVSNVIQTIRTQTDRHIIVRPHPRYPMNELPFTNVSFQYAKHVKNDKWDLDTKNVYAVVNYSSGPGIEAAINGVPVFVGEESLAHDIGNPIYGDYLKPHQPDYETKNQWLNDLTYTEWDVEEISKGIPLKRLEPYLQ